MYTVIPIGLNSSIWQFFGCKNSKGHTRDPFGLNFVWRYGSTILHKICVSLSLEQQSMAAMKCVCLFNLKGKSITRTNNTKILISIYVLALFFVCVCALPWWWNKLTQRITVYEISTQNKPTKDVSDDINATTITYQWPKLIVLIAQFIWIALPFGFLCQNRWIQSN